MFVIGTQITPQPLLERVIAVSASSGSPSRARTTSASPLSTPGDERRVVHHARQERLGIYSVGEYTSPLGIPLVTVEVPWSWPDMRERIAAQTAAVQAVARYDH